jgi:hypothetical protein
MTKIDPTFEAALASFVKGCDDILAAHHAAQGYKFHRGVFETERGPKNVRVVLHDGGNGSRRVHCFVEIATGNVLKADGWKKPAKHARGNIFDANNGLGGMGPHGALYLR